MVLSSWLLGVDPALRGRDFGRWILERFTWWDSWHFLRIADVGYPPHTCCDQAFFPGYPLVIRALSPLFGSDLMLAGLVTSELAGAAAAVLLWHLASGPMPGMGAAARPILGKHAVLYLAFAPYGVYLSVVYGESLFLACTLAAWLAATRRRWWWAGLLAGAAAAVRINGAFLAVALAVMYAIQLRAEGRLRPHRDALALLTPLFVVLAFFAWLHRTTGSWSAWRDAEVRGWQRRAAWPWDGLRIGWHAATAAHAPEMIFAQWADLLTTVAGLVLIVVLVRLRRWPEATYLAPNVAVLVCSTTLVSAPRYALAWFPGYLLAAQLTAHPRAGWLHPVILVVCVPLLAGLSLLFAKHAWVS